MAGRASGFSTAARRRALPLLLALACGLVVLALPAGAAPIASGPAAVQADEAVSSTDAPTVAGPVVINVDESVLSKDAPTATGPAGIGSSEPIATGDAVSVVPPVGVFVGESVSTSDAVSVVPPLSVTAAEPVKIVDAVTIVVPTSIPVAETAHVSDDVSIRIVASAPDAPTGVVAAAGDASAAVSWLPPVKNGGAAISGYTVTAHDVTTSSDATLVTGPGTSALVTGLTNGDPYTFTVTASNSAGPGPPSTPSAAVTPQAGSAPPAAGTGNAPPGGTVVTGGGTSGASPLGASVTTPTGGTVSIVTAPASATAPGGYSFFGQGVVVTAPPSSAASPLSLTFTLDGSILGGVAPSRVQIFRDGVPIADCTGPSGQASPDPCVASRAPTADGGVVATVLSSHASSWNFGLATAPVASAGGPYSSNEGAPLTLHGSATSAAGALTYSWDLGGGVTASGPDPTVVVPDGPATTAAKLTVCDLNGACGSATATITTANVAPAVKILSPADGSVLKAGSHVSLSGSFTDPGTLDTHHGTWTVGGTSIPAAVVEHAGSGTAKAIWTPAAAGFYPLSLTVVDKDGGPTTVSGGTLVVFDKRAGSVRGAGALLDPGHNAVLFAFGAGYRGDDSTPDGGAELHVPHLNLFSTHLDWLVVTSPSFELRGSARGNGTPGYRFRLSAVTGRPDQLRVRVWSPGGALLYDSTLRPLRLGNISIDR